VDKLPVHRWKRGKREEMGKSGERPRTRGRGGGSKRLGGSKNWGGLFNFRSSVPSGRGGTGGNTSEECPRGGETQESVTLGSVGGGRPSI